VAAARLVPVAALIAVVTPEIERELNQLEADLKRLEAEYNMFFAGRLSKPPWETRSRVDALVKRFDRSHIQNYGDRFRFMAIQARYAAFIDLWDRGLRAREEGRAGPFSPARRGHVETAKRIEDRILHVTAFRDPMQEMDKLHDLYEAVAEARREVGADSVPFHRFVDLVKTQVQKLKEGGGAEVAFRVAVKDAKVNFTARVLRGAPEDPE
jgi:hypothetical protein